VSAHAGTIQRNRLLVIDARILTPNRDGGSLRMFNLLQIFRGLDFDVSFVPSFPQSFPPFAETLREDTAGLHAAGIGLPAAGATVDEYLRRAGHLADVILLSGAFVAARHLAAVRRFAPHAVCLFDTIDLHFLREYRAAKLTGNVPRLQSALKLKRTELAIARVVDATLVVSEREKRVLEREDPRIRAWVVPSVQDVHPTPAGLRLRRDLLFLGAYSFEPNVDAMVFFVRHVWPDVQRRLPGVRLRIAGADPTAEIQALEREDIEVTGPVGDLAGCFDRCRVFIAPLRFGAGIKSKLLLSMAHGVPVVASPMAVEGLPARDGEDVLVAETPGEWASQIGRLYDEDALWSRLSANGRSLVHTHYSVDAVGARVATLVEAIRRTHVPGGGTPQ
jgi:glycosyltransferase involved in cell wall biosynthesis